MMRFTRILLAILHGSYLSLRSMNLCLALLLVMLTMSGAAHAQVLYGTLTGNVTDPNGAALPGAQVGALNVGTGVAWQATSNDSGVYRFVGLQPGVYNITISAPNFNKSVSQNVRVDANTVRRVDAQLTMAARQEHVTVTAEAPLLQTDRADVHAQLEASQIQNLPITSSSGRSFQSLYRIIPGFGVAQERNSGAGNPQRSMTANVNGGSEQGNATRIDGALNTYVWLPANVAYVPPADSIEAVSVVTNSFDAEQGMAGGAAINVLTKSGTNQFHGSAYEFHTDNALKAQNYFDPRNFQKPKDILNQFGANLGGPIKKNKLFFFGDWERTQRRQKATRTGTVPNPTSIFDASGNVSFLSAIPAGTDCNVTRVAGCIYDPNTGNASGTGRIAFPNNTIPANRIDPAAKTMLSRIDTKYFLNTVGVTATNNYFANRGSEFNRDNFDGKINYTPNERTMIFGRYSLSKSFIFDPQMLGEAGGSATGGGQPGDAYSRIQSVGLGGSYTISSNMLIDVNAGYTRQRINAQGKDVPLGAFGLDTLKIPGTNGSDPLQGGIPSFQTTGWANMGNDDTGSPFLFRDYQYVANTNLSWMKGRHDLRFGLEHTRSGMNHFQPQGGAFATARGTLGFDGNATALADAGAAAANQSNSLAQFLLGLPSRVGKAIQIVNPNSLRFRTWSMYARDRWQVTPKLTLSYGVRWEYYPFATADHRGVRVFDPTSGNVLIGGYGSVPLDAGVDVGRGLFLPRLGIAYRVTSKMVIRAGYGMSADNNNFRFLRNAYPTTTIPDLTGSAAFGSPFAPAASLTGEALTPYSGLTAGIPSVTPADISSGIIPLPNNVGTTTVEKNFRRGYFHSYNLTVQREFAGFVGEASYVGTRGIRLLTNMNINAAPAGGGSAGRVLNAARGRTWPDINSLVPYQNTYYDSLQTKLTRRLAGSSMIGIVYTLSKTIDSEDNEELGFLLWPYPAYRSRNKALAGFDRTHNLAIYGVYELPFGRTKRWAKSGVLSALAGGWQVNWVLNRVSGTPLTITGGGTQVNAPGNTQTADQVGPLTIVGGIGPRSGQAACPATVLSCHYFDPSAFAAVPTGQVRFGTSGRNIVRGPGFFNLDTSVFRDFKITERLKLQFRAEAFGATNTPHFNNPGTTVTTVNTVGVITSTLNLAGRAPGSGGERWFWLAAKLIF